MIYIYIIAKTVLIMLMYSLSNRINEFILFLIFAFQITVNNTIQYNVNGCFINIILKCDYIELC